MDLEPTTMRPVSPKMEPAYLTADPGLIRFIGVLSQSKVRKARADFIFFLKLSTGPARIRSICGRLVGF